MRISDWSSDVCSSDLREVIDPARNQLGKLAAGIAAAVNAQNAAGVDQAGNRGGDLLTMPSGSAFAASAHAGSATLSVAVSDVRALSDSNSVFEFDCIAWHVRHAATGERKRRG